MVGALLDDARASRSGVLVLRGEPGIGKTALLDDARERAQDMHVLAARGVEAEAELPFAALHQLIRPALGKLDELPAPQANGLRAALGLAEGTGQARFLVFAACLSLLSEFAETRPVLCLVDDAHWFDEASADALRFVGRRLDAEGIAILIASRVGETQSFESFDLPTHDVEGLGPEAAARLLARGAGVDAAPSVRDRLLEQTRGNALALVELPSTLSREQLAGVEPLPEVLPVTRQIERAFLERTQRLPEDTQRLLVVAAADDSEDVGVVSRAATELGVDQSALDAAEHAGLIQVHGRRLEFRHPLVRSALYESASATDRRAAHAALAAALAEDETQADRRVWHLASATLDNDTGVIESLEAAAERAESRNGHVAAAKALLRAADMSSDPDARGRRLTRAAANLSLGGRDEAALLAAREAAPLVSEPSLRAALARAEGRAAIRSGRPADVVTLLMDAARSIATTDPPEAITILMDASIAAWQDGDRRLYLEVADVAATIEPAPDDETTARLVRSLAGFAALLAGNAKDGVPLLEDVTSWGGSAELPYHVMWASFAAFWLGNGSQFGALVDRAAAQARERGELGALADALGMRSTRLAMEQKFDEATVAATEALQLARELGADNLELLPRAALALAAAYQGRDDDAHEHGEYVLDRATANRLRLRSSPAVYALALIDMARGRWTEAASRLGSLAESSAGQLDPLAIATVPDRVEAAVRAGDLEQARAVLPLFEARAAITSEISVRPRLEMCRALLAEGDVAVTHFEAALAAGADARPHDLARIRLLYGEHLRRARRRTDARVQLRAALEGFERLGAEPWAERARSELRASGETARKREPSTVVKLTPQELQVARLVAEGLSNKEVAAQLFLSRRTIDAHLRNVFAKLGITSRTQLARMALAEDDPLVPGDFTGATR